MSYFLSSKIFSLLKITACSLTILFCFTSHASTQVKPKVCMILDKGGKDDHSFNESAAKGFEQAVKTLPISPESKFVEPHTDAQISQFFNSFSTAANCDLIVAIGFTPAAYVAAVAAKFPQKKYLVVDSNLEKQDKNKNILSITFEEHEGSFLAGAIAALKST
ncbi:MAG: BMP family ABC transporter substrate-binding protein, partial [Bdellovibrionota bacterium]